MDGQKDDVLEIMKRLVPGTKDIEHCQMLENCMNNKMRHCGDIKKLCIPCKDSEIIIGGISFLLDASDTIAMGKKNGIIVHRYGQAEGYVTMVEGKSFDDVLEKFENDEVVKDITEKTKLMKDEQKEAEINQKIEAFKRSDAEVLLTKKSKSNGEYEDLDKKLIEVAKEKEKETGRKIKIIDESEIEKKFCILGVTSKKVLEKLELESKTINNADHRINIFAWTQGVESYVGILAINSIDDDVNSFLNNIEVKDEKDRWRDYFVKKYKGLQVLSGTKIGTYSEDKM